MYNSKDNRRVPSWDSTKASRTFAKHNCLKRPDELEDDEESDALDAAQLFNPTDDELENLAEYYFTSDSLAERFFADDV